MLKNINTYKKSLLPNRYTVVVSLFILLYAYAAVGKDNLLAPADVKELKVKLRYGSFYNSFSILAVSEISIGSKISEKCIPAGTFKISATQVKPAVQRFHVFPKTFSIQEMAELDEFLEVWRKKGYSPEVLTFGRAFRAANSKIYDNRSLWVSLQRYSSQKAASELVKKLENEQVWAWIRPETVQAGQGNIQISDSRGKVLFKGPAPVEIRCVQPLALISGEKDTFKKHFAAPLQFRIGPAGEIEVLGELPLETYLRGVLPAEMPSSWPLEALKTQAVAARSEILSDLNGKYHLDGYDFTILENCRVYNGIDGHTKSTDRAVLETTGVVLVNRGKVAATVFSACCGGWTESNENVWAGPANPILRAVPDFPEGRNPAKAGPEAYGLQQWLASSPDAWCSEHKDFRWRKKLTKSELSEIVNKLYNIGVIKTVRPGKRGASGRLEIVTLEGTRSSARVDKELNIRQLFGGLPSAMFIITSENVNNEVKSVTIFGGGRGHGVGLCQQGAKAMAERGLGYMDILRHYFTGAEMERFAP